MTLAQIDLREKYMLNENMTVAQVFSTPADFFNKVIFPNIYVISGIILFALLIGGGITIIASGGDPKGTEKGTQVIKTALIGFLIIISAFWIIQIVEIVTGIKILQGASQ
jgi:hypothetical protein